MSKWIGEASLTMRSPWRIVLSYRFYIGRASLCSPFYEVIGCIDEDLDPGRRQAHVRRARLLIPTRHTFVDKERRAIEVKPSNAVRSHNWLAPSAFVHQLTAAAASDTINITERAGRAAALLIAIHYVTGFGARQVEHGLPVAEPVARSLCIGNDSRSDCRWPPSSPRHELRSSRLLSDPSCGQSPSRLRHAAGSDQADRLT